MGRMRATLMLLFGAAACLGACKRSDIYSKQSLPAATPISSLTSGTPDFVGRWAATRADCPTSPWVLTPAELDTPGQTHCRLGKLSAASAGYSTDVVCTGPAPEQLGRVTLTMSGEGASRGLTLSGGPFTLPVALTPCPAAPAG